ncbi:putative virion structural protein [Erwinia phage vB_EamM_Parshik]|nr:putative virion structural protein [Erwinia phage vB_EamM_Parshik]
MGIKLDWVDQSAQQLTAIEIYRSATPISTTNPGTPLVTLPGNATSYEDSTVKNKSRYYYRIAAVKGSDKSFSPNQLTGYFAETGPGRSTPMRGDWNAGFMDVLPMNDFVSMSSLFTKLPGLAKYGPVATTIPSWYKMCYQGKVLFVPSAAITNMSWNELYAEKAIFGEESTATLPNGTLASGKLMVEIGGLNYIVRCPKLSPVAYSNYVTLQEQTVDSEWRDTVSRLAQLSLEPQAGAKTRLMDLTGAPFIAVGGHLQNATQHTAILTAAPGALSYGGVNNRYAIGLILELVMP